MPEPTQPIRVAWAREYAEFFAEKKYIHIRPSEVIAFVTVVEKAHGLLNVDWADTRKDSAVPFVAAENDLRDALSRFDFAALAALPGLLDVPANKDTDE